MVSKPQFIVANVQLGSQCSFSGHTHSENCTTKTTTIWGGYDTIFSSFATRIQMALQW
jgi:hypothetical protein